MFDWPCFVVRVKMPQPKATGIPYDSRGNTNDSFAVVI